MHWKLKVGHEWFDFEISRVSPIRDFIDPTSIIDTIYLVPFSRYSTSKFLWFDLDL